MRWRLAPGAEDPCQSGAKKNSEELSRCFQPRLQEALEKRMLWCYPVLGGVGKRLATWFGAHPGNALGVVLGGLLLSGSHFSNIEPPANEEGQKSSNGQRFLSTSL